jgi:serine phosphatase RsbU (regulator of sigma subunit)
MHKIIKTIFESRFTRFVIFANLSFLLFFASYSLVRQNKLQQVIQQKTENLKKECDNLLVSAQSPDHYISSKMRDIFWGNWQNSEGLKERTREFLEQINIEAGIIIWDKSFKVTHSNFDFSLKEEEWKQTFQFLHEYRVENKYHRTNQQPEGKLINARKLLGNFFSPIQIYRCVDSNNPQLISTSFSSSHPKLWLHAFKNGGMILFFPTEKLNIFDPLKFEIEHKKNQADPFRFFILKDSNVFPADLNVKEKFSSIIEEFQRLNYRLEVKTIDSSFLCRQLSGNKKLIGQLIHSKLAPEKSGNRNILLIGFVCLNIIAISAALFFPYLDFKRIKAKLLLLFIASSLLPLAAFVGIAVDYLHEYRAVRLAEINQQSLKFLQKIDEGTTLAYSDQLKTMRKSLPELLENLQKHGISKKPVVDFISQQHPRLRGMFIVGSTTKEIANEDAIVTRDKVLEIIKWPGDLPFDPAKVKQCRAFDIIFKALLANLNGRRLTSKQGIEMEMVMDSIGQSDYTALIQSYFESLNSIWRYGFGRDQYPNFITLLGKDDYDYNLLVILRESALAEYFAHKTFTNLNRNQYGLKIGFKTQGKNFLTEEFEKNRQLHYLLDTSHENNSGRSSIVNFDGKSYSLTILHGHHNKDLISMTIYPLARIDEEIDRLGKNFWLAGFLSTLTVISLGLLISGTVLDPIRELKAGVNALKNRNFKFQLPDLGQNEFGHLGRIFNRTLEDMQELQVASLVQEKLIPQLEMTQYSGSLQYFGKTESLNDLGGDYFDLIETEDGQRGFLLGDVAGHGVAASLIVAFVKAAIIRLENLFCQPSKFFNQLNRLFRQTQGKNQKKFMSLQYLLFDEADGTFAYLNAGHCFPILVDSEQKTTTYLKMVNSPLGTSKKEYPEPEYHELKPGQALVMYSDGYYEIPGMDLEKFQEILLDCFDQQPKKFFDNVNERLNQHGFIQETDDKTLLIVSRVIE